MAKTLTYKYETFKLNAKTISDYGLSELQVAILTIVPSFVAKWTATAPDKVQNIKLLQEMAVTKKARSGTALNRKQLAEAWSRLEQETADFMKMSTHYGKKPKGKGQK